MAKRLALFITATMAIFILASCMPMNNTNLYQRSMVVSDNVVEERIMAKAHVDAGGGDHGNVRMLYLEGTPYEMGFQHGKLMREEIHSLYGKIMMIAKIFASEDMMEEAYDLMDPYIPIEEKEEMRGLAHGADIPLKVVHWVHAIPEVFEYDQKTRFSRFFKGTSCSNIAVFGKAAKDGKIYHLRVLDWIRLLGAQKNPLVIIHRPDMGHASATFSYAGFIGCISGMNDQYMSFGEKGSGGAPETIEGTPFPFLFRKLMREASSINDVERILRSAKKTCAYVYMFTDAKATDDLEKAAMFIVDRYSVVRVSDDQNQKRERAGRFPPLENIIYFGVYPDKMYSQLTQNYGNIGPEVLMQITKYIAMDSNMQNVIFAPETLEAWVSNADNSWWGDKGRACNQKWYYFDLNKALKSSLTR
jgi:hypothetical protein